MASKESEALNTLYKGWVETLAKTPDLPIEDVRRLFEHWGDVTSEPRGVDYTEVDAGGIPALWAIPKGGATDSVLQATHGGGYVVGSPYSHRKLFGHIAKAVGVPVLIIDYRRAPEHLHPAPVEDAVRSYQWLLSEGFRPEKIGLIGDSAGGALAVTTLLLLRERGLPLPAASVPLSPWTDLLVTGPSVVSNHEKDHFVKRHVIDNLSAVYLGDDGTSAARRDPLASPLYANLSGLPPLYVQVGGDETLLDDAARLVDAARAAGVEVKYDVYPEQQHVFHFLAGTAPEATQAVQDIAEWLRPRLGLGLTQHRIAAE
jgi:monoterpene epsilon-lactone hydrolase